MNEITSVTTKGSWVTMIMKISAGSSGARRAQSADRRSAPPSGGPGGRTSSRLRSRVVLIAAPPGRGMVRAARHTRRGTGWWWWRSSGRPSLAVARGDVVGQLLAPVERLLHGHPTGDGGADVLGHPRAEVGELGDADELDAGRGARLHAWVLRGGGPDRLDRRLREGGGLREVVRVLVGRRPLARRDT